MAEAKKVVTLENLGVVVDKIKNEYAKKTFMEEYVEDYVAQHGGSGEAIDYATDTEIEALFDEDVEEES